jgi:DNA-binding GntR family transcriptional regulator
MAFSFAKSLSSRMQTVNKLSLTVDSLLSGVNDRDMNDVMSAIAQRRTQTLTDIVQGEIERMVLAGELAAGERINEQALAARLGVSRGPIREATRGLVRSGLLNSVVNLGVFVRQIPDEEANEIYDVRAVVFGFVCQRLAGLITAAQLAALSGLIAQMDEAIDQYDGANYYRLNLAFHDAILDFAAHGRARQTYEALIKETHLLRQSALSAAPRMRESNAEHKAIVEAMAAGDADRARLLAEDHAHGGKRRWLLARQEAEERKET